MSYPSSCTTNYVRSTNVKPIDTIQCNDEQPTYQSDAISCYLEKTEDKEAYSLNPGYEMIWDFNFHLRQVFINRRQPNEVYRNFLERDRLITDISPKADIVEICEKKTLDQWPERGYLLSDIEFLTKYSEPGDIVFYYENRDENNHIIEYTASIFESLVFYAHKSNGKFYSANVITYNDLFDISDVMKNITDARLLIISYSFDMAEQLDYIEINQPYASLLNFDIEEKESYYDGDLKYPIWSLINNSWSRLTVTDRNFKEYDGKLYLQQLFYFQQRIREHHYLGGIERQGLDHCYDCNAEVFILKKYIEKIYPDASEKDKMLYLLALSSGISDILSSNGRTLLIE